MAVRPRQAPQGADGPVLRLATRGRPEQLRPLRRMLRQWLESAGATHEEIVAMQVAAAEAAANAVEHAYYGTEPGIVWLVAELEPGGVLRVEVGDCGRWRPRHDLPGRGRGLQMMRECVDDVRLSSTPQGTTVVLRLQLTSHAGRRAAPSERSSV